MADDTTYCPYCGASMNVGATFCPSCGAQIGAPAGAQSPYGQQQPNYQQQQPYGQQYNENVKLESNLRTVGIVTIVLAVLGLLSGISVVAMSGSVDLSSTGLDKTTYMLVGVGYILLAVVGGIGAYCCLKKTNYGLGLAMYIISIILSLMTGIIGVVIAIIFLVFYTKAKPVFN